MMQGWLIGFVLWTGISLGCMALLLIHTLSGGRWGDYVRRGAEAAAAALSIQFVWFLVLWAVSARFYPWGSHPTRWLSGFGPRGVVFFLLWLWTVWHLRRQGRRYDETGDREVLSRLQRWAGPVLVLYLFTSSLATVDWVMSLTPSWGSSIFPFIQVASQLLTGCAFLAVFLSAQGTPAQRYDVGSLLLTFVILQAYTSYSEWIIVWSGNMSDEITFHQPRLSHGWEWVIGGVITLQWALPFVLLIWGRIKQNMRMLRGIGVWLIVAEYGHTLWLVAPAHHVDLQVTVWDVCLPLLMGIAWWMVVRYVYRQAPPQLSHPYRWGVYHETA